MFLWKSYHTIVLAVLLVSIPFWSPIHNRSQENDKNPLQVVNSIEADSTIPVLIKNDIRIKHYFGFIDSLTKHFDKRTPYPLTEHLLIRANPWIIDTLQNTDYYRMRARDSFVFDQKEMIVIKAGSILEIPAFAKAKSIISSLEKKHIDINIPEYKLRVYEDSLLLYEFTVRVGRNEKKYLKMGDRITDLRTIPGSGMIVNHVKNPDYYNPATGHQYLRTKRDDQKVTKLPQIPFLVTEINGLKNGQLIHPTTNPISLGKAYSNGCIGTREADAWVIYYQAPIGTRINIRYDLNVIDEDGKQVRLEDIYGYSE